MRAGLMALTASLFLLLGATGARAGDDYAADDYTVTTRVIADEKAVFATVESRDRVAARVRTAGTIARIAVKEGDAVTAGQVIAESADEKLVLQQGSLDATIAALTAQLNQAGADLARAENLIRSGATTQAHLDELRTAATVAAKTLDARRAERAVLEQQLTEGAVLAPTTGRVLTVPVTAGMVVMSGETIATIAAHNFVLRLRIPESYARFLKTGNSVRLDSADIGSGSGPAFGTITLVYPDIADGRVIADAEVPGLGDDFVGERVRVWITGGQRPAIMVPSSLITTRFGLDYAHVKTAGGAVIAVPVQRGQEQPHPGKPTDLDILSGLKPGDVLVAP